MIRLLQDIEYAAPASTWLSADITIGNSSPEIGHTCDFRVCFTVFNLICIEVSLCLLKVRSSDPADVNQQAITAFDDNVFSRREQQLSLMKSVPSQSVSRPIQANTWSSE